MKTKMDLYRNHLFFFLAAAPLFILLLSCGKGSNSSGESSNIVNYSGVFKNASSPDSSKATGTVMASFNKSNLQLTYTINWSSLTSIPVQMHFHDDGPVIIQITGFPVALSGTVTGTCTFTSAQGADLAAGFIYAMIHTSNYTAGEISATLVKQ
jgi:hypothetical protein